MHATGSACLHARLLLHVLLLLLLLPVLSPPLQPLQPPLVHFLLAQRCLVQLVLFLFTPRFHFK
jgi:hypothetical protein